MLCSSSASLGFCGARTTTSRFLRCASPSSRSATPTTNLRSTTRGRVQTTSRWTLSSRCSARLRQCGCCDCATESRVCHKCGGMHAPEPRLGTGACATAAAPAGRARPVQTLAWPATNPSASPSAVGEPRAPLPYRMRAPSG
eukprot:Amastigsp_a174798_42.p5 type:complete len:142 gc:universal Amastigsp_a174798_42:1844-1419(-)